MPRAQMSGPKDQIISPLEHWEHGLSGADAAARLKLSGYNDLPSSKPRSVFAIGFSIVREPMFALLVGCGTIYLLLGSKQEALMRLGFVFVVMGITFFQEHKAERALEASSSLASPRARVMRGGKQCSIPGREVVSGDIVMVTEGDRVPADCLLLALFKLSGYALQ